MKHPTSTLKIRTDILEKAKKHLLNVLKSKQSLGEFFEVAALALMETRTVTHYRSSKSGRYVKKKIADVHPNTTVKETDQVAY